MNLLERKLFIFANAVWWDKLTKNQQEAYLKEHPRSRLKVSSIDEKPKDRKKEGDWLSSEEAFIDEYSSKPEYRGSKEAIKKLKSIAEKTDKTLFNPAIDYTQKDLEPIRYYSKAGFCHMNQYLRTNTLDDYLKDAEKERIKNQIKKLDTLIEEAPPLKEDTVVYRGVNIPDIESMYKKGKVYEYPSFMSTSASPSIASRFSRFQSGHGVFLQLKVKKGTRALYLPNVAATDAGKEANIQPMEKELLFKSKTKFKVIKVENTDKGTVIHAEII